MTIDQSHIYSLRSQGLTQEEIGYRFGLSQQSISRIAPGRVELHKDLREAARRAYAAGFTQEEIAQRLGVNQATISRWVEGIEQKVSERKQYMAARIREERTGRKPKSIRKIALAFGVHPSTIIRRAGSLESRATTARRLYRAGETQAAIAKELGVNQSQVSRWLSEMIKAKKQQRARQREQERQKRIASEQAREVKRTMRAAKTGRPVVESQHVIRERHIRSLKEDE